ncbi:MAG: FG-GAP-like repeat-containing protein [Tunicatimonas sp.]
MNRILITCCAYCFLELSAQAQLFRADTLDWSVTVKQIVAVELTQDEWVDYFVYGTDPSGNAGFWIYENRGDATFGQRPVSLTSLSEVTFAFADFDRDNQLDLLVSGIGVAGPVTELYYNQSGTFSAPATLLDRSLAHSLVTADFDQDGRTDIFLGGITVTDSAVFRAYRNTEAGFVEISTPVATTTTGTNAAYDWDNDGRPDLLQTGRLPNGETVTRLYRNRGGFAFDSLAVVAGLPSRSATALATGDVNLDGRVDLLLSSVDAQGQPSTSLYVFQDSVYGEQEVNLPNVAGTWATLADFNHDGLTDVGIVGATAAGQTIARWYLQTDTGWTTLSYDSLAVPTAAWAVGDVDNDGHLDVLRGGLATEPSLLLLNQTADINAGPAAPANPTVSVIDTVTVFGWEPDADDQTDAEALTYELYVIAQGGDRFAVSPEYQDTTKARVDHGRVGYATQYAVNGLPEGTYTWGVAAVDNSFQIGSAGDGIGQPLCFTIARDDTTLCAGTTLRLRTDAPVAWSSTLTGLLKQSAELNHVVRGDEVLYYTALSATDCALAYSLRIQTIPAPSEGLLAADTTVCPGASLTLAVDTTYTEVNWFSATQGMLGATNQLEWEATQEDTLWVVARLPEEACPVRDTMVVAWFPSVDLLSEEEQEITVGNSVRLLANGAESYQWSPAAGLSSTEVADPVASPSETTTYTVEGITANGCVALDTIVVLVSKSPLPTATLFVPNLFSPNGDGQNDTFRLYGPGVSTILWQVYDRQGNQLFEAHDLAAGWNGEHRGRPVPNGVYLWKVSGKGVDGTPLQFEGQQSGMLRLVR